MYLSALRYCPCQLLATAFALLPLPVSGHCLHHCPLLTSLPPPVADHYCSCIIILLVAGHHIITQPVSVIASTSFQLGADYIGFESSPHQLLAFGIYIYILTPASSIASSVASRRSQWSVTNLLHCTALAASHHCLHCTSIAPSHRPLHCTSIAASHQHLHCTSIAASYQHLHCISIAAGHQRLHCTIIRTYLVAQLLALYCTCQLLAIAPPHRFSYSSIK